MEIKPNKIQFIIKKATQETIEAIIQSIREGGTRRHSAEANGISERHFYYLIQQGRCDIEHGFHDSLPAHLVQSLRKIELKEIKECRKQIRAEKKGHKGAEWTLEHVYWKDFSGAAPVIEFNKRLQRMEEGESDECKKMD